MNLEESVKAWSLVTWLQERDADKFVEFVSRVDRTADQVKLVEDMFGLGPELLDDEWRAYVLRNY